MRLCRFWRRSFRFLGWRRRIVPRWVGLILFCGVMMMRVWKTVTNLRPYWNGYSRGWSSWEKRGLFSTLTEGKWERLLLMRHRFLTARGTCSRFSILWTRTILQAVRLRISRIRLRGFTVTWPLLFLRIPEGLFWITKTLILEWTTSVRIALKKDSFMGASTSIRIWRGWWTLIPKWILKTFSGMNKVFLYLWAEHRESYSEDVSFQNTTYIPEECSWFPSTGCSL